MLAARLVRAMARGTTERRRNVAVRTTALPRLGAGRTWWTARSWRATAARCTARLSASVVSCVSRSFGVMWDFPDDPDVHRLCREVYEAGGFVPLWATYVPCGAKLNWIDRLRFNVTLVQAAS